MKYAIEKNDSFKAQGYVMGATNSRAHVEITDSIEWADIFRHELAEESVYDVRGKVIPSVQSIVDIESGESLSLMGDRFALMQPARFSDIVQESLAGVPHRIVMGGTFNGRRNLIVGVEFEGLSEYEVGGEKHRSFEYFGTSIDGSAAMHNFSVEQRMRCFNQFASMYRGAQRAKNTQSGEGKFVRMIERVESLQSQQSAYRAEIERLANTPIAKGDARAFVAGVMTPGKEISTRTVNVTDEIFGLFVRGVGNVGETRADLFNGFTEYFTHQGGSNKSDGLLGSSLMGKGAEVKRVAFNALNVNSPAFAETVTRGKQLLAAVA